MLSYSRKKGKKGQVGETVTWLVATIIIIVVLIISIYTTSLLANIKKTLPYKEGERKSDLIMEKSLFAYFSVNGESPGKESMYNHLEQQEFFADLGSKRNEIEEVLQGAK